MDFERILIFKRTLKLYLEIYSDDREEDAQECGVMNARIVRGACQGQYSSLSTEWGPRVTRK
jgi:hypothetical protein